MMVHAVISILVLSLSFQVIELYLETCCVAVGPCFELGASENYRKSVSVRDLGHDMNEFHKPSLSHLYKITWFLGVCVCACACQPCILYVSFW